MRSAARRGFSQDRAGSATTATAALLLAVADTNYAALTGADGSFTIDGLRPGEYKIKVWHEKLGKGKGTVTVKEDGTSERVEIKMGDSKKKGGGRRRR